jgi:hypothetical protein
VWQIEFKVQTTIKGKVPAHLTVQLANKGMFASPCDDRPPVENLDGLSAVIFIQGEDGVFWTLDGPDSIYAYRRGVQIEEDDELIVQIRRLLETD